MHLPSEVISFRAAAAERPAAAEQLCTSPHLTRLQFRAGTAGDTLGAGFEVVYILALRASVVVHLLYHRGWVMHGDAVPVGSASVPFLLAVDANQVGAPFLPGPRVLDAIRVRYRVAASVGCFLTARGGVE